MDERMVRDVILGGGEGDLDLDTGLVVSIE